MNENIIDRNVDGIDLGELSAKYEERGIFRRLGDMFAGLGAPCDSREYQLARLELQRLAAPLVAIVSVGLCVTVLIVVTAIQSQRKGGIVIDLPPISEPEPEPPLIDPPEPPDPEPIEPVVEIAVDVPTPADVPTVDPVSAPNRMQSNERSVKPAEADAVAVIKCPVKMIDVRGGPDAGMIGTNTDGRPTVGDVGTESAVMKVLWWLKAHQNTDGSWGRDQNAVANTAFAVLTYLAHGEYPGSQSPYERDFGPAVRSAVDYLLGRLATDGAGVPHFAVTDNNEYSFLIATYALCEAYAMTHHPSVKDAAEQCLRRIVENQSPTGGWDYKLNRNSTRDDLSYAGWAIQALKAGKMAGVRPEGLQAAINKAIHCLKKRSASKSGGFTYTPMSNNNGGTAGLAGVGTLAMQFLGRGTEPEALNALEVMRDWTPAFEEADLAPAKVGACPQYYCYYATQCKYQAGMKPGARKEDVKTWVEWNAAMRKLYPAAIKDLDDRVEDFAGRKHKQGYYENADVHSSRPYMDTCLAALQLMVYYRYLPTTSVAAGADDKQPAPVGVARTGAGAKDVGVTVDI